MDATRAHAGTERPVQVLPFEITEPPPGWVDFCAREPTECAVPTTSPRNLVVSAEVWSNLDRVNNWVNATVKPLTDIKHWGVVERWSIPDDGYGDCEDYVLLKRRILMQAGWPREALLVTVVLKGKNEGHTVLTVTTDKGDYVLDNLNKNILLWSATGYRFVKRQSQANPDVWVSLDRQPTIVTADSNSLAPRHHEPRPPLARPGQGARSARGPHLSSVRLP
jgi:predicted transglutaminase-like cysteine proteinase